MIEFRRILCPIDFSETSNRSLAHAAALASWYDAQLTLLHVVPSFAAGRVNDFGAPVPYSDPVPAEQLVEDVRRQLGSIPVPEHATVAATLGDASAGIVEYAETNGADLIVMGTHGRRGVTRLLLGSVAEKVLFAAPCPVLTVPPHASGLATDAVTFKRILCPMDFSDPARHALALALDLARQADGTVTLLHVVEWLAEDSPRLPAELDAGTVRRAMAADAQQQMDALVEGESRTWCDIEPVVGFGRAHREILRVAADRDAELIVMGAQGRGGVDLALFGSTTQQVVRGASCPVLTARSR